MLIFHTVRYKNILSTGNVFTEIFLDKNRSTLIVGENGAGKSTMLDAICFALYGKAFRKIKKQQLINSINGKGMVVELEFSTGGKHYLIRRGIKPNLFEIWCDNELVNQEASARDYQVYLEDNIIKMNYKSFGQIVVLGSSTFIPFMQLSSAHRREIIEDLLDIQIFTAMNSLLKDKVLHNQNRLNDIKHNNELLQQKIDSAIENNESIRTIRENALKDVKGKVKEQMARIDGETAAVDILNGQIDDMLSEIADKEEICGKLKEIEELLMKLEARRRRVQKESTFYRDHDNCPTCHQDIDQAFKEQMLNEACFTEKKLYTAYRELWDRKSQFEERIAEIGNVEKQIQQVNIIASEHRANIKFAKDALSRLKREMERAQIEVEEIDATHIERMRSVLDDGRREEKQLAEQRQLLTLAASLLREGGVKTQIIKQYVPVINKLINKYLAAMDFFVQFELDEAFNETIKSRFRDEFSYSSFSEGEKLRIDIALLLTWRAVSKLRNSVSTNLLIMDEIVDSSLDDNGTEEFLKIINDLAADSNGQNIFIISHKGGSLHDKFDHIIRFEKVKNFSRIAASE